MHILKDICNNLEYQLEDIIKKGDMTPTELDLVYKSVKTMYYIKTIDAMENYSEEGYSRGGYYEGRGGNSNGYNGYNSYAGGGNSNGMSYRRGRYSRDNEREGVIKELGDMMSRASSDIERQTIAKLMDRFE